MNKIIRLVSIQMGSVLTDMLSLGNSRKKKSKAFGYGGLALFVVLMTFLSFMYVVMISEGLKMFNSLDILPSLMMAVTSLLVLMTTIFKVKGTIFAFKDYDLVMSLPVSTTGIVASRLLLLYVINMLFVSIIMIPTTLVYGIMANPRLEFYIISLITLFFIPLVPIALASILGTFVAYISSRFRYKNLFNIIFSIIMVLFLMFFPAFIGGGGQKLVDMSRLLTNQVNELYPLASFYTKAAISYDILSLIIFIGISVVFFILYSLVVGRAFKWLNSKMLTGASGTKFKMGEQKVSSPFVALYKKEMKRFFTTPVYVLNTGFGVILATIGIIALLVIESPIGGYFNISFDISQYMSVPEIGGAIGVFGPLMISFFIMLTSTTSASISLEGKNLWILKSLPVSEKTIFFSKLGVNITVLTPLIFDIFILLLILKVDFILGLIMITIGILSMTFVSTFGLLINTIFPNFNWTTETVAVKQSASTLISMLGGVLLIGLQYVLLAFIQGEIVAHIIYLGILLIVNVAVYGVLMNYGVKKFRGFLV